MIRVRAIACALKFGILPWWLYEEESHFAPMSYLGHLAMNLALAARWATWHEEDEDRVFEREVNSRVPPATPLNFS